MSVSFFQKGDFSKTTRFLEKPVDTHILRTLEAYADLGTQLLSSATPVDTGETALSWGYKIVQTGTGFSIEWFNTKQVDGVPLVILLQYGHGTRSGGYVEGIDFINPPMAPLFKQLAYSLWKELIS